MGQITVTTFSSVAEDKDSETSVLTAKNTDKNLLKSAPSHRHAERKMKKNSWQQSTSGIVSIKRSHFKRKGTKLCTVDVSLLGRLKDNVGSGGTTEW